MLRKKQERILQLHSLLSKLVDSLCLQVCVNRRDDNWMSLLQILMWQRKNEIDQNQFVELYRSWLESKSIFDLQSCKQYETFPKHQFIEEEIVQQNFMNVTQINKALQSLNFAYNKLYLEKRPNNSMQLDQAEKIFSYLDSHGYIHLRLSNIFFFTGATAILQRYTIPLNYDAFRVFMNDVRKQASQLNGIISLRNFKNYMLNLNTTKRSNYLDNLLTVFNDIQNAIGFSRGAMPDIFDDVFHKWRLFPRFNTSENKRNLQIYRRLFQENEKIFYDEGGSLEYFLDKYGEQFVKCFQIDSSLLREFNVLIKESLNKYIQVFAKISHKSTSKTEKNSHTTSNLIATNRKKPTIQPKLGPKIPSLKQKTPTKSHRAIEIKNMSRTPTRTTNIENRIRKQFGSTQKSKQKSLVARQLTPTKSIKVGGGLLSQSQAYTGNQKSAIKVGVQKDSFYNKMQFFRNKRVESYQIVMKRLKGK